MLDNSEKKAFSFYERHPYVKLGILIFCLNIASIFAYEKMTDINAVAVESLSSEGEVNDGCNVAAIDLYGDITTYIPKGTKDSLLENNDIVSSESVVSHIRQADKDDNVKAILLQIDSYGGSPVAGEEIANALLATNKPTVALIRETGSSAAYWAGSGADHIIASQNSDVGSIGVTMSYMQELNKDKKYIDLSIGKFKDSGTGHRALTEEERALFMRDLNIVYDNFVTAVAKNRELPRVEVMSIADGSSVLGKKAKELGLIDEVGGIAEAEAYLEKAIGEKPEVCWWE